MAAVAVAASGCGDQPPKPSERKAAAPVTSVEVEARVVPPQGVLVAAPGELRRDGAISRKFPWWRGARGHLRITGERLDRPGPRLRARVPSGYGPTGFQPSAIVLADAGCWQVTARAGTARMTFVTLVVRPRAM